MNALLFSAVWFLGLQLEACVEHLFPCRVVFLSQVSDLDSLLGVRHLILQPVDLLEPPCRLQLFYVGRCGIPLFGLSGTEKGAS